LSSVDFIRKFSSRLIKIIGDIKAFFIILR
jgi:hypothetical protein